jgi:uncharacterized membrane protein YfcA
VISTEVIVYTVLVYLLAGSIKGTVGIGLPMAAIGISSQFIDPRMAISLVVFPVLFSNTWQVFREGKIIQTFKSCWLYALTMMIVLVAMTFVTARIDTNALLFVLGLVIFTFAITGLWFSPPALPDRFDSIAQFLGGSLSGVLGGLTAIWAPPIVIYLMAKRVDKDAFVRITGVLLFLGSISLCIGFWQAGLLTGSSTLFSIGLAVPTLLGFSIGEILRRRLNSQRFRTLVLLFFLVMGLNLIRRSII